MREEAGAGPQVMERQRSGERLRGEKLGREAKRGEAGN